jgi:hypothetical protein
MSDTPRTDEEAGHYDGSGWWKSHKNGECVTVEFSRELERELNTALSDNQVLLSQRNACEADLRECQRELAEAREQIGSMLSVKDERDKWRLLAEDAAPDVDIERKWWGNYARLLKLYPVCK